VSCTPLTSKSIYDAGFRNPEDELLRNRRDSPA
jgi:hypothetical protein